MSSKEPPRGLYHEGVVEGPGNHVPCGAIAERYEVFHAKGVHFWDSGECPVELADAKRRIRWRKLG